MTEQSDPSLIPAVSTSNARRLFVWGVIISATYVIGLLTYAWWVWAAMLRMDPDQFATFLSGVFAPLAFLWLVLGFRQQGDELQNSARALWLQGEELRNSVEQQRQLVEVSREQLASELVDRQKAEEEAERAAQPQLHMPQLGGSYSGPQRTLRMTVTSGGPNCSDVRMLVDGKIVHRAAVLQAGGTIHVDQAFANPESVRPLEVSVEYTDNRGYRRNQRFHIPVAETGGPNGDRTLGEPARLEPDPKLS